MGSPLAVGLAITGGHLTATRGPSLAVLAAASLILALAWVSARIYRRLRIKAAAAEAVRGSESRFRFLVEATSQIVWTRSPDGEFVGEQAHWQAFTGQSFEEYRGWGWLEAVHPDDRETTRVQWTRALERGTLFTAEKRIRRLDGEYRHVRVQAAPVREPDGSVREWIGTDEDITERKRAEMEREFLIEASEILVSSIDFDARLSAFAQLAVPRLADWCVVDLVGDDHSVRRSAAAYADPAKVELAHQLQERYPADPDAPRGVPNVLRTGEPEIASEISESTLAASARDDEHLLLLRELGLRSTLIVPLKVGERVLGALTLAAAESERRYEPGDLHFVEEVARRAALAIDNMRLFHETEEARAQSEDQAAELEVVMEELQNQARQLEKHQAGLEQANEELRSEIQRRVGSEERLRASRESYVSLFDNLTEAVYLLDLDGRFLKVNEAVVRMYGYAREEVAGQTPAFLADPERVDLEETVRLLQNAARGEPQRFEWWGRRKDGGTFPKEVVVSRATYQGQDILLAVARDITERKAAEEALRRSEEQLQEVQKMEAIGRLSGGIAHDFNNLLTVINGNTQMLLLDTPEGDPTREDLVEIKRAADRAAGLTSQLLAFSRKQMLQSRVLDLNAVVTGTDKMLRRLIGADVELVTVLAPDLGRIRADAGQLEQVLVNLAVNARDAMPDGGKLVIETRNVEWTPLDAHRYPFVRLGGYVEIRVRDAGSGIPDELRERIFEPFFTTKERGKGTGLGLSTVYGIVKQSGGFIWVESELGRGSTFTILLPQVEANLTDAAPESSPTRDTGGWETILLVEDEQTVRGVARRVLTRQGYTVLEAANGEEGLRVLEQLRLPIHLVLTDVVMPLMGGRQLAERVRDLHPEIPVLYMSGYTDDSIEEPSEPGTGFLQKPFDPAALALKVREMLDIGRRTSSAMAR